MGSPAVPTFAELKALKAASELVAEPMTVGSDGKLLLRLGEYSSAVIVL